MKILIVDDDRKLADAINHELEDAEVHYTEDGEVGIKIALEKQFDLIVLNWTLPKTSGQHVLKELRKHQIMAQILMMTATDSAGEVIVSLNSGANACVAKALGIRVLLASLKALIRRSKLDRGTEIRYEHIRLDPVAHKVWNDNKEVVLTPKEYGLLVYFMQNPEQVVTREMIAENVWGNALDVFSNMIDVYVNCLRRKIDYDVDRTLIHTVKRTGYVFKSL